MKLSSLGDIELQKIHFIGIGGIGMSGLARFFVHEGKAVTGSDRAASIVTDGLTQLGVTIAYEQSAANITSDIDMVVYTEAMAADHPEMLAARALGVPMMNYFEALGLVANPYYLIAVAGSHGKTTTTAMLADVLEEAAYDPTVIVGSLRSKTGSNFRPGHSKYAIVEACEYKRDFLHLEPDVLVITNIEFEHVDYYQDLADVQDAFRTLALKVPAEGYIVTDSASDSIKPCLEGVEATVVDYRPFLNLTLPLRQPGMHTRLNAAAAAAAAAMIGIDAATTATALENFAGTWRRFEYKGDIIASGGGLVPVFDDYGHHPTELAATFTGARELHPGKRLVVVFQSHTYSRTYRLYHDFVAALAQADEVHLLPIYAAREENTWGVTSEQIATDVAERGVSAQVWQTPAAAAAYVGEHVAAGDMVVVIGAGAVTAVATALVANL